MALRPFSAPFLWVYALTGLTDVLDGSNGRKTHRACEFGARLDSVADLLFYAVMLFRIFPFLWDRLPKFIWIVVAAAFLLRISAYTVAAVKYRWFASLHTYLNKFTGLTVFLIPFLFVTRYAVGYCFAVSFIAVFSSLEELVMHLQRKSYPGDKKFLFQKKGGN